jgi:N-acetylglucosaminyl-diphospho-decaprenol L-rhamnosyltransferase
MGSTTKAATSPASSLRKSTDFACIPTWGEKPVLNAHRDLTLIVVEYFNRQHLHTLAKSIRAFEPDVPVLISSNSVYDTAMQQQLRQELPGWQWLHNGSNLGYAGGVNRALANISTPYAAILNPDVELVEPLIEKTRAVFENNPQLAIFGPRVQDGSSKTTYSFRRFYPPQYILARYLGVVPRETKRRIQDYYLMADASRDQATCADWVSGGAMFVRMDAVRAAGGMDERYFLYMEDMDWCRIFWCAGWNVAYRPDITLIHRAQHQTTRGGLHAALSPATRHHLKSYAKYVLKWGLSPYNPADSVNN